MQSLLGGGVISLFLFALYAPWFTNSAMLVAIVASFLANLFLMAGIMELLPDDNVSAMSCLSRPSAAQQALLPPGAARLILPLHQLYRGPMRV